MHRCVQNEYFVRDLDYMHHGSCVETWQCVGVEITTTFEHAVVVLRGWVQATHVPSELLSARTMGHMLPRAVPPAWLCPQQVCY